MDVAQHLVRVSSADQAYDITVDFCNQEGVGTCIPETPGKYAFRGEPHISPEELDASSEVFSNDQGGSILNNFDLVK